MANTSRRLQMLKKEGLVAVTRNGNHRTYHLANERIFLWEIFQDLAQTLSPKLVISEEKLTDSEF